MKIRDVMERLSKLDPEMDMNDLRECLTTNSAAADELVASLDADTDSWDEFSAALTRGAVIPMLLEIRDLMLMPTSARGWLKPAEMAKKVAEQVEINEAKCRERIADVEVERDRLLAEAEEQRRNLIAALEDSQKSCINEMRERHDEAVDGMKATHEAHVARIREDHEYETNRFQERIDHLGTRLDEAQRAVPGEQARAVASVLSDAADRLEAMAQMRLARLVKRKSLFRNKDLDQTMLRVEADGIMVSAKRLRQMAAEAEEQGDWPVEFAAGEEDTPEAKEALSRMLTPVRKAETLAEPETVDAEIEVEAD